MTVPIVQVDAFANRPFEGNPAAVCVLQSSISEILMQNIAREMNLSETAFVWPLTDGFSLRWFTPAVEVDLCGHATLASAHVLWEQRSIAPGAKALFHTRSGLLTAQKRDGCIELDFPSKPAVPSDAPDGLLPALGFATARVARSQFDYLVEVDSERMVYEATPDFGALRKMPARGVIVTARSSGESDFVSRFFAPAVGVDEDPVTGSAHCTLAPYWSERLGKLEMAGRQISRRGGNVRVRLAGDRVMIGGQAITVLRGQLTCA
jgi:PhzF family phenazine biosynthesis protein